MDGQREVASKLLGIGAVSCIWEKSAENHGSGVPSPPDLLEATVLPPLPPLHKAEFSAASPLSLQQAMLSLLACLWLFPF